MLDIKVNVIGRDLQGRFAKITSNTMDRLRQAVIEQTEAIANRAKTNIAQKFRNPALMQSAIGTEVKQIGNRFTGTVDASGRITGVNLPFMRIQEYGGFVKTPEMFARRGHAFKFHSGESVFSGSANIFASHTRAHPTTIPERSFLRLALEQRKQQTVEAFKNAVQAGIKES